MATSPQAPCLPHEVLEQIFSVPCITHKDVCRISSVCRTFRIVCESNELWKKLYERRWPRTMNLYSGLVVINWKEEYREHHVCSIRLLKLIEEMSHRYYYCDELSYEAFDEILEISDHKFHQHFLIDELEKILYEGDPNANLTIKYYTHRALRIVRHRYLESCWKEFLSLPEDLQFLEKGALLFAKWCQPSTRISKETVWEQLESMANAVLEFMRLRYPNHPVCHAELHPADVLLTESLWSPSECRLILTSLSNVMFNLLKFKGNNEDYYNASNSYINLVLEQKSGIQISLCVIYSAIARRLGVVCLPVSLPGHFILKWKEYPDLCEERAYTFIDVFRGAQFLTRRDCVILCSHRVIHKDFQTPTPIEVFRRMCWNIVDVARQEERIFESLMCLRNALELLELLSPDDVERRLHLARAYLQQNINFTKILRLLTELSILDPTSGATVAFMRQAVESQMAAANKRAHSRELSRPKLRSDHRNVVFAIGMIMRHKKYDYTCVIYGWDPTCTARKDWIYQMGVHNLTQQERQPFYNVLVDDGTNRYAAQENLEISLSPKVINHPEVGKYFQRFCETYYEPNEEKMREYPEDSPVRMSFKK